MQFGVSTPLAPFTPLIGPIDLSGGPLASPWISLADYVGGFIVINIGTAAGNTSAVTLDQATDKSGTGSKTLAFTKYYQVGQMLFFDGRSAANFVVGETITGGTSNHTAKVIKVSSDILWITTLTAGSGTGTTWTDNETITGGTSGATASVNGTGEREDVPLELTAGSNTFNTLAITYKQYIIPVDNTMLDGDNDFNHFQLDMGDAGSGTIGGAIFVPFTGRTEKYPAVSLIGDQKFA